MYLHSQYIEWRRTQMMNKPDLNCSLETQETVLLSRKRIVQDQKRIHAMHLNPSRHSTEITFRTALYSSISAWVPVVMDGTLISHPSLWLYNSSPVYWSLHTSANSTIDVYSMPPRRCITCLIEYYKPSLSNKVPISTLHMQRVSCYGKHNTKVLML